MYAVIISLPRPLYGRQTVCWDKFDTFDEAMDCAKELAEGGKYASVLVVKAED